MKLVIVLLALFCSVQWTQGQVTSDFRKCVNDVLKALEGAMVGVDGWANWYYDALNTLESFETKRAACDKLAENDPPNRIDDARIRACRTNINLEYTRELQRLSDDFMKISVGMEDVADRAIRDIRRCIRRLF